MGWFLTRKKAGKPRGRKASTGATTPSWSLQRAARLVRRTTVLAMILALVGGWYFGEQALRDYLADRHGPAVTPDHVRLAEAPEWMTPAVRDELKRFVAGYVEPDPLEVHSLRAAATALGRQPWVRQVEQVRRRADGGIEVRATYRRPVAVVQGRDGYHLVDAQAVRLPRLYLPHHVEQLVEQTGIAMITGITAAAPPAGEPWPGEALAAALALVRLLEAEPYADAIKRYDASGRDVRGRVRLTLYTDRGEIRWGLAPGQERAIEPDAAVKKRWLSQLHEARGDIDAGGRIVHLYGATVEVSNPSSDAGAAATR